MFVGVVIAFPAVEFEVKPLPPDATPAIVPKVPVPDGVQVIPLAKVGVSAAKLAPELKL